MPGILEPEANSNPFPRACPSSHLCPSLPHPHPATHLRPSPPRLQATGPHQPPLQSPVAPVAPGQRPPLPPLPPLLLLEQLLPRPGALHSVEGSLSGQQSPHPERDLPAWSESGLITGQPACMPLLRKANAIAKLPSPHKTGDEHRRRLPAPLSAGSLGDPGELIELHTRCNTLGSLSRLGTPLKSFFSQPSVTSVPEGLEGGNETWIQLSSFHKSDRQAFPPLLLLSTPGTSKALMGPVCPRLRFTLIMAVYLQNGHLNSKTLLFKSTRRTKVQRNFMQCNPPSEHSVQCKITIRAQRAGNWYIP